MGLKDRIGVTTLAPNGITADWITKPISILGPEKGLEIIEKIPRRSLPALSRLTNLAKKRFINPSGLPNSY